MYDMRQKLTHFALNRQWAGNVCNHWSFGANLFWSITFVEFKFFDIIRLSKIITTSKKKENNIDRQKQSKCIL